MVRAKLKYEERIVLFLDILGFKELVNRSSTDNNECHKIQTAIRLIRQTFKITQKSKEKTVTQFSDSLVVSFKITEKGEVAFLLAKTQELIKTLILNEIICRGGIAKGKLIHNNIFLFGPAFDEAYKLESEISIFPRVIIKDKSILDIGVEYFGYHLSNDPAYEKSEINSLIKTDSDGFHFIDYFNIGTCWELLEMDKFYVNMLRELIVNQLKINDKNLCVKPKYQWMKDKFNEMYKVIKTDNRIEVGGIIIGADKKSTFYRNLRSID